MLKKTLISCALTFLCFSAAPQALWGRSHFYKSRCLPLNDQYRPKAQELFNKGQAAFNQQRWSQAARHLKLLTRDYHANFYPNEAYYLLGVSFYELDELDLANQAWNTYLARETEPTHLDDVMAHKIEIAERCRLGASARLFGLRALPKWSNGDALALTIYDELIATLPSSDLAAVSLVGRARLFCKQGAFQDAIDNLFLMVKRFPQHELTPDAFLAMQEVYLAKAKSDGQNPDTLSLAELALNRFASNYPKDPRLEQARELFAQLRDVQAYSLYRTALFYQRLCQPKAAILYCKATMRQFPDTPTAKCCSVTLERLQPGCPQSDSEQATVQPADMPSSEDMPADMPSSEDLDDDQPESDR